MLGRWRVEGPSFGMNKMKMKIAMAVAKRRMKDPRVFFLVVAGVATLFIAAYLAHKTRFSGHLIWCVSLGVVTFALYGLDKRASVRNRRRVPEITLHALNLAGGFVGGFAGRWVFRHKTQKILFLVIPAVGLLIHLVFRFWL